MLAEVLVVADLGRGRGTPLSFRGTLDGSSGTRSTLLSRFIVSDSRLSLTRRSVRRSLRRVVSRSSV